MINVFQHEIKELSDQQLDEMTSEFITEFGWDKRNEYADQLINEDQKQEVHKRMHECFGNDFNFEGDIPYISFYNLLGIRKRLTTQDDDALIAIVAPPGKGKSSMSMTFAKFIDKTFTVDRVIFNLEEFKSFLENATNVLKEMKEASQRGENPKNPLSGTCIVLDEGVYMIFSGDATSRQGKFSQKLFSIIRALNLIVIVNITNFKKINKGVVEDRLFCMWRIKNRGTISFLSKKRIEKIQRRTNEIRFPSSNFGESIGKIDNTCQFWKDYEVKKSTFLVNAVLEDS